MTPKVTSVLFDIEGTIHSNGEWIEGALDTIQWLLSSKIKVRFITNKTNTNQETIRDLFEDIPFTIPNSWIYTPVFTAKQWFLKSNPKGRILPLVHSSVIRDLEGLQITQDANADYVLLGNMDDEWNIQSLNTALKALLKGAKLTALEMNKSWVTDEGHRLLAGPFVKALEYASDTKCEVTFGKPSKVLFNMVFADINTNASETLMVGDDLEADIIGAAEMGIRGFLVKTGRFSGDKITEYNGLIEVADSVASLKAYLEHL